MVTLFRLILLTSAALAVGCAPQERFVAIPGIAVGAPSADGFICSTEPIPHLAPGNLVDLRTGPDGEPDLRIHDMGAGNFRFVSLGISRAVAEKRLSDGSFLLTAWGEGDQDNSKVTIRLGKTVRRASLTPAALQDLIFRLRPKIYAAPESRFSVITEVLQSSRFDIMDPETRRSTPDQSSRHVGNPPPALPTTDANGKSIGSFCIKLSKVFRSTDYQSGLTNSENWYDPEAARWLLSLPCPGRGCPA